MPSGHPFGGCLAALLLLSLVSTARAQVIAGVDASATRVEFAGGDASSVLSLAPSLEWNGRSAGVLAQMAWSRFGEGGWSAQGAVSGSAYGGSLLGLTPEIGGAVAGTLREGDVGTGRAFGALRLHYAGVNAGSWAGGALGRGHDSELARTSASVEAGAWARIADLTLAGAAVPTWIGDEMRYTDLLGVMRLERGRVDASAFGGWRAWSLPGTATDSRWAGATVAVWMSRNLAAVAGAGSYPADWALALPSGRFAMLSLRIASRRPAEQRDVVHRMLPPAARPIVPAFDVEKVEDGGYEFVVRAPGAASIEVMGDFTAWAPVALVPGPGGRWSATFTLSPGAYRMNIRVNGGDWGVPPGVLVLDDEFGGVVGVLAVD